VFVVFLSGVYVASVIVYGVCVWCAFDMCVRG